MTTGPMGNPSGRNFYAPLTSAKAHEHTPMEVALTAEAVHAQRTHRGMNDMKDKPKWTATCEHCKETETSDVYDDLYRSHGEARFVTCEDCYRQWHSGFFDYDCDRPKGEVDADYDTWTCGECHDGGSYYNMLRAFGYLHNMENLGPVYHGVAHNSELEERMEHGLSDILKESKVTSFKVTDIKYTKEQGYYPNTHRKDFTVKHDDWNLSLNMVFWNKGWATTFLSALVDNPYDLSYMTINVYDTRDDDDGIGGWRNPFVFSITDEYDNELLVVTQNTECDPYELLYNISKTIGIGRDYE